MFRASPSTIMHSYKKSNLGTSANDSYTRDATQSRLHEPLNSNSGIEDTDRKASIDTPMNHPNSRLPFHATDSDDRGG